MLWQRSQDVESQVSPGCFPAPVPQVCSHYNRGNGLHGSCKNNASCMKLHMCQHFLEEDCRFGSTCKRAHSFNCNEKPLFQFFSQENIENRSQLYRNRFIVAAQELQRDAACSGKEQSLLFTSLLQRHRCTLTRVHVCPLQRHKQWRAPLSCLLTASPRVTSTRMKSACSSSAENAATKVTAKAVMLLF